MADRPFTLVFPTSDASFLMEAPTAAGPPVHSPALPPATLLEEVVWRAGLHRRLAEEGTELGPALQDQAKAVLKALVQELTALREQLKRAPAKPDWETQLREENELRARLGERLKRIAAGLHGKGETT